PAKSGRVPLPSFCVESGRWKSRGKEDVAAFSSSAYALTDNRLKLACRGMKDQRKVWEEVANAQKVLAEKVKAEVRDPGSATSLQLTLENRAVRDTVEKYVAALGKAAAGEKGAVGVVVVINGKVNNADVYASAELFGKLWPKLLRASAAEAAMHHKEGATFAAATKASAEAFLADAAGGKASETKTAAGHREQKKETEASVRFQTQVGGGALLRGSYLAK
ncbi:MAG: ARPP-1 family domain-containing protein, partial [Gemmataceae bacterium]